LDASSPLLSHEARRAIAENDGFWPSDRNNHIFLRENIKFKQIIVSFCGVSSASGNMVYARSVFEYEQLCVGYTFVPVLFTDRGKMQVDVELLNDIRPQNGGGAEPWDPVHSKPTDHRNLVTAESFVIKTIDTAKNAAEAAISGVTQVTTNVVRETEDLVDKMIPKTIGSHQDTPEIRVVDERNNRKGEEVELDDTRFAYL
jgi:hypothetical protein